MTPEERAGAIASMDSGSLMHAWQYGELSRLIASAIRDAEIAMLEKAGVLLDEGHDEAWGNPAEQHGWSQAAKTVRSLKSKGT